MRRDVNISEIATGRWPGILAMLGIEERFLKNKHGPCPFCGGKDRYRFDDVKGRGTYICNQCGSGDGFKLLELVYGWSFKEAASKVFEIVGSVAVGVQVDSGDEETKRRIAAVKRIWNESVPVEAGDPVHSYLTKRAKAEAIPSCIRHHPALMYADEDGVVSFHPALVAAVTSFDGLGVGIHRIYLTAEGEKANVPKGKKLLKGKDLNGASIKLGKQGVTLGIAEGIETAMAASTLFDMPVWASISAGLMEQWVPPSGVENIIVFADNDESYTGQASAFILAKKLKQKKFNVTVRMPKEVGTDWADELAK